MVWDVLWNGGWPRELAGYSGPPPPAVAIRAMRCSAAGRPLEIRAGGLPFGPSGLFVVAVALFQELAKIGVLAPRCFQVKGLVFDATCRQGFKMKICWNILENS